MQFSVKHSSYPWTFESFLYCSTNRISRFYRGSCLKWGGFPQRKKRDQLRPQTCPGASQGAESPATVVSESPVDGMLSLADVQRSASQMGLTITVSTLGPLYRILCRQGGDKGDILGFSEGFVAPILGYIHCDKLKVFPQKKDSGSRQKRPFGVARLLGRATFCFGFETGCRQARALAINDDDQTHARLVSYFKREYGFKVVKEVEGGRLADLPDLLVWGGVGTRLDADLEPCLRRWGASKTKF
eukprot:jgi/Botrbrau1/16010/Bobra.0353s0008.1